MINTLSMNRLADGVDRYIEVKNREMLLSVAECDQFTPEVRRNARDKLARELGILPL